MCCISTCFICVIEEEQAALLEKSVASKSSEQPSMISSYTQPQKKYPRTGTRQKELNDPLVNYIAGNLLALCTVDSEHFQNFDQFRDPRFIMPSRKHLSTTLIDSKSDSISRQLISQMQGVETTCLTIDFWASRLMHSFMRITGPFVKDLTSSTVILACIRAHS